MNDKWEFYQDVGDQWRWRRIDLDGIIAGTSTGGYENRADCEENARHNGWDGKGVFQRTKDSQIRSEANGDDEEPRKKALDLYLDRGFKDGNTFVSWLGGKSEQTEVRGRPTGILLTIVGLLFVIAAILVYMQFTRVPPAVVSETLKPEPVTMVVPEPKVEEKMVVFSDIHFNYDEYTLSLDAKSLLDQAVTQLNEHPDIYIRLAGYTSAKGTQKINQKISEQRANSVRKYLINHGIAPERITVIGYGRTKPALYEAKSSVPRSKEALANMRVLFEIVAK